eukprot:m.343123 g.343123  ORF g.343123 m.343123 type:complete len:1161 (+) comp22404_c0_seq1:255-3737(+)
MFQPRDTKGKRPANYKGRLVRDSVSETTNVHNGDLRYPSNNNAIARLASRMPPPGSVLVFDETVREEQRFYLRPISDSYGYKTQSYLDKTVDYLVSLQKQNTLTVRRPSQVFGKPPVHKPTSSPEELAAIGSPAEPGHVHVDGGRNKHQKLKQKLMHDAKSRDKNRSLHEKALQFQIPIVYYEDIRDYMLARLRPPEAARAIVPQPKALKHLKLFQHQYFKVEDYSGRDKPFFKEYPPNSLYPNTRQSPCLNLKLPTPHCPFSTLDEETMNARQEKAKNSRRYRRPPMKAWCECCQEKYYHGIEAHRQSAKHRLFATNSQNYKSIDDVIEQGLDFKRLLLKTETRTQQNKPEVDHSDQSFAPPVTKRRSSLKSVNESCDNEAEVEMESVGSMDEEQCVEDNGLQVIVEHHTPRRAKPDNDNNCNEGKSTADANEPRTLPNIPDSNISFQTTKTAHSEGKWISSSNNTTLEDIAINFTGDVHDGTLSASTGHANLAASLIHTNDKFMHNQSWNCATEAWNGGVTQADINPEIAPTQPQQTPLIVPHFKEREENEEVIQNAEIPALASFTNETQELKQVAPKSYPKRSNSEVPYTSQNPVVVSEAEGLTQFPDEDIPNLTGDTLYQKTTIVPDLTIHKPLCLDEAISDASHEQEIPPLVTPDDHTLESTKTGTQVTTIINSNTKENNQEDIDMQMNSSRPTNKQIVGRNAHLNNAKVVMVGTNDTDKSRNDITALQIDKTQLGSASDRPATPTLTSPPSVPSPECLVQPSTETPVTPTKTRKRKNSDMEKEKQRETNAKSKTNLVPQASRVTTRRSAKKQEEPSTPYEEQQASDKGEGNKAESKSKIETSVTKRISRRSVKSWEEGLVTPNEDESDKLESKRNLRSKGKVVTSHQQVEPKTSTQSETVDSKLSAKGPEQPCKKPRNTFETKPKEGVKIPARSASKRTKNGNKHVTPSQVKETQDTKLMERSTSRSVKSLTSAESTFTYTDEDPNVISDTSSRKRSRRIREYKSESMAEVNGNGHTLPEKESKTKALTKEASAALKKYKSVNLEDSPTLRRKLTFDEEVPLSSKRRAARSEVCVKDLYDNKVRVGTKLRARFVIEVKSKPKSLEEIEPIDQFKKDWFSGKVKDIYDEEWVSIQFDDGDFRSFVHRTMIWSIAQ